MPTHAAFNWTFHRIGGLDQVTLRTPEELLHLDELDPKLWVALSCPINKLQFDARTLELLDTDKDGRIRVQEHKYRCKDVVRYRPALSRRDKLDNVQFIIDN